jgi:hypothetical protein
MPLVLQFELILKIGSIKCAYGRRQKNISRAVGAALDRAVIHLFAWNDRHYDLPEYWPFLPGHFVYETNFTTDVRFEVSTAVTMIIIIFTIDIYKFIWTEFAGCEVFTAVTIEILASGMWRRVSVVVSKARRFVPLFN